MPESESQVGKQKHRVSQATTKERKHICNTAAVQALKSYSITIEGVFPPSSAHAS